MLIALQKRINLDNDENNDKEDQYYEYIDDDEHENEEYYDGIHEDSDEHMLDEDLDLIQDAAVESG